MSLRAVCLASASHLCLANFPLNASRSVLYCELAIPSFMQIGFCAKAKNQLWKGWMASQSTLFETELVEMHSLQLKLQLFYTNRVSLCINNVSSIPTVLLMFPTNTFHIQRRYPIASWTNQGQFMGKSRPHHEHSSVMSRAKKKAGRVLASGWESFWK